VNYAIHLDPHQPIFTSEFQATVWLICVSITSPIPSGIINGQIYIYCSLSALNLPLLLNVSLQTPSPIDSQRVGSFFSGPIASILGQSVTRSLPGRSNHCLHFYAGGIKFSVFHRKHGPTCVVQFFLWHSSRKSIFPLVIKYQLRIVPDLLLLYPSAENGLQSCIRPPFPASTSHDNVCSIGSSKFQRIIVHINIVASNRLHLSACSCSRRR
jgi:hypothetical protein